MMTVSHGRKRLIGKVKEAENYNDDMSRKVKK